jgi:uncharacterized repeat protein (TIGR03803 family)
MRNSSLTVPVLRTIGVAAIAFALVPLSDASAYAYKTLHDFSGPNGSNPTAGLLEDGAGNLYGTTSAGGKYGGGIVFKMVPNGTKYDYHIIKNFCAKANCTDGSNPSAHLIMDADGDIWGTTVYGGKFGSGTLFELIPGINSWALKVIHSFGNGTDGWGPYAGLTYTGQQANELWGEGFEPAFGTTASGGKYTHGVVYKLARSGSTWTYTIIHNTKSGAAPQELAMDSSGNLFGTANEGGANGGGLIFRLASGTWKETTLHEFCGQTDCTDGGSPVGRLWIDNSDDLFGATQNGGTPGVPGGVVFEYTHGGSYQVLYSFCSVTDNDICIDGQRPLAGLIMDSSGALFGTTWYGGRDNRGTAFTLVRQGGTWQLTTIGLLDYPAAPLTLDGYNGSLYGTDSNQGAGGHVFELTP